MADRLHDVALTPEEIHSILAQCGTEALLVGGQALAFWAEFFQVRPTGELSRNVTSDVDFIGSSTVARKLGRALGWKVWLASMDDATAQTAMITKLLPDGGVKQVAFLGAIVGLDTERVRQRAVDVSLEPGEAFRVLQPIDVLESRLRNIESLPEKRNGVGVAQGQLAVEIVARFLEARLKERAPTREVLDAIERVAEIALDKGLARVAVEYGVDPLPAVPATHIHSTAFRAKRWPQIIEAARDLRQKAMTPTRGRKSK